MREEIGERSSGMLPDDFCCYFHGLGVMLTVATKKSMKNHPEPTSQIPKIQRYHQKRLKTCSTKQQDNKNLREPRTRKLSSSSDTNLEGFLRRPPTSLSVACVIPATILEGYLWRPPEGYLWRPPTPCDRGVYRSRHQS